MSEASYSVIRYVPDPGRGERLNVGILLWDEDDFRVELDEKAVRRVVNQNPHLDSDALLYIRPMFTQRLSSAHVPIPTTVKRLLDGQRGFPIDLSEPRFTNVDDEGGFDATVEWLTSRIVHPRSGGGGGGVTPTEIMERRLKPLLAREAVSRNHFFGRSKTGVRRKADFFANSGA